METTITSEKTILLCNAGAIFFFNLQVAGMPGYAGDDPTISLTVDALAGRKIWMGERVEIAPQ